MSYLAPSEFVTKMIDAGESKIFMSTRDTLIRAYMAGAEIIVLDEPTAALDAQSEYETFLRFVELTRDKTAVIISHRFSTVRMADRIAVLGNGRLLEIGAHAELMASGGLYAELFNLQAQGYQ